MENTKALAQEKECEFIVNWVKMDPEDFPDVEEYYSDGY